MDKKYDINLKAKDKILSMIVVLYLLTIVAFVSFRENIWVFLILLTIFSGIHLWLSIKAFKSIGRLIENLFDAFERCFASDTANELDLIESDEAGRIIKENERVIKKFRAVVNSASEAASSLQEHAQGITDASCSLNNLNAEIAQKTNIVNSNVGDIDKNIDSTALLLSDVMENVFVIAASTEEMSGSITTLATASGQASSGVEQVSQLVEQISESIDNVADSAKDVSDSVESIVTSVKEINLSLNKVNQNCERSISITMDAGTKAKDTNKIINDLDNSAKQIGKIVNVISKISNQTNMLALNAAIEAAGAGEAGKGFAVVASEVKVLANQTAAATEEIRQQIENMQENMSRAVAAVIVINEVIEEITEISNTIGSAVTEQYVTTSEISNAVVKSAEKVNNISEKISQVAGNTQNAARNIFESSKGIKDIADSASELSTASNEVAKNAENSSSSIYNLTVTFQEVAAGAKVISENIDQFFTAFSEYEELTARLQQCSEQIAQASQKLKVF